MRLVCEEFVFLQTQFFLISMKVKSILISQPKPEIKNSPYVELIKKFKLKYLERDVAEFEPRQALDGGLDGLSVIRKVIKKSSELIKKNGKFVLEIGFDQKNEVINLLKKEGFYINSTQKDLANNDRCIVSTKI